MAARRAFLAGLRDLSPALASLFPIAVILGVTAVEIGLTGPQAVWMAIGVYTGLAQAAMLELIDANAHAAVVVLAGALINLRLLMYSASLAPYLDRLSLPERLPAAYLVVDTVYAVSYAAFERDATDHRLGYYLGAALGSWVVWQVGTVVGVLFGDVVPSGLNLRFAIPLVFIALLVPVLDDRPSLVAGAVGGAVAVVGVGLPFNAGLVIGAALGITAGIAAERRWSA